VYHFQARFSDGTQEINVYFYRQYGEAVIGFPASKFVEADNKWLGLG
jgi:hypothetical protein